MKKKKLVGFSSLIFGYAFLYLPIFYLVVSSFNKSSVPGVWDGFSMKWYYALLQNDAIMHALLTSLQIAGTSATLAVLLGTMAAISMVRLGSFKGRTFLLGLLPAPLVMPEVITGLSLLLMFVTFPTCIPLVINELNHN